MKRLSAIILSIALSLPFVACGVAGGSSNAVTVPGDPGQLMSELSDDDLHAVCEQYKAGLLSAAAKMDFCGAQALAMSSAGAGDCDQIYQDCQEEPVDVDDMDCDEAAASLQDCSATAGEFESCINQMIASMNSTANEINAIDCSSDPSALESLDNLEDGQPACLDDLEAKCPGMGGD